MAQSRAAIAEFLRALDETQYLSPARLQAYQRRLLARLLDHARRETAFYADRLDPVMRADGSIDWDRWQELPILTRSRRRTISRPCARARCRRLPAARDGGHLVRLDRPAAAAPDDRHSEPRLRLRQRAVLHLARHRPRSLTVRIRAAKHPDTAYPKGRRTIGWRAGHEASEAIDLSIATPVDRQIEWLAARQAAVPRHATRATCARLPARRRAPASTLRFDAIMTFGEMTSDDMRAAVEDYFGLPPLDRYGSSEVGQISATCPHSLKHHVTSELVLLEIVDADGQPPRRARSAASS